MNFITRSVALLACTFSFIGGCASSQSSSSPAATQAVAAKKAIPIPPDSPLAKVKEGMGMAQVTDLIGPPTDTDNYITGKGFNPFYYGGDTNRMKAHYKGLGRITFTRSHAFSGDMRVMEGGIEYDPKESGYK